MLYIMFTSLTNANDIILERIRGSKQAGWVAGLEKFNDLQWLLEYNWEWKQRFLNATTLLVYNLFSHQKEVNLKAGTCNHRLEKQGKVSATTAACSTGNRPNSEVTSLF